MLQAHESLILATPLSPPEELLKVRKTQKTKASQRGSSLHTVKQSGDEHQTRGRREGMKDCRRVGIMQHSPGLPG